MIIERYIIRNFVGPFFFSMSMLTFVFIMDFILKYIDLFLGKGVPFPIVMQTFVLSLGHMFALIIPMAVLPATLMTFGNFASENEITAMKASGLSLYRMILPGLMMSVVLAAALALYNNYVLPESNHKLMNLIIDINKTQPTVKLKENRFSDEFEGYTLYFKDKDDRTGDITDVQVFKHTKQGRLPTTIVAESGHLQYLDDINALRVDLYNGEMHELPRARDRGTYRRTRFLTYRLHIRDIDRSLRRSQRSQRGDREMSVRAMQVRIDEIHADVELADVKMIDVAAARVKENFRFLDGGFRQRTFPIIRSDTTMIRQKVASAMRPHLRVTSSSGTDLPLEARDEHLTRQEIDTQIRRQIAYEKQIDRYRVEIHKKFSIPFACVIFVLVGSPLAIRMGKSGMGMAIGLSVLFFMVYYVCLIGGEKVADRGLLNPALAMWAPNIIFAVVAIVLLRQADREQSARHWTIANTLRAILRRDATATSR